MDQRKVDKLITWQVARDLIRECGTLPTDPHLYLDLEIWLMAVRLRKAQKEASLILSEFLDK